MANKFKVSLLVNLRDMFYTFAQNEKRYGIFPDRNIRINNICDISMYEDHEFKEGSETDVAQMMRLIDERIAWMDANGIDQWNNSHYREHYPEEYYVDAVQAGRLYVLYQKMSGKVVAGAVLLEKDGRWDVITSSAYYVHNLVAAIDAKGAGKRMLEEIENLCRLNGKKFLRLDCSAGNKALNRWYESLGFRHVGAVIDGEYTGNLMEKKLT